MLNQMKVKNLIEELMDCDQESEILSNNGGRFYYHVSKLEKGNILESNSQGALIDTPVVILTRENTACFEKSSSIILDTVV